jgi:hypothetical protein
MFRVEPLPIITSSDCTYSFWYLSNIAATCCDHGWDRTEESQVLVMGGVSTRNMRSVVENLIK